MIVISRAIDAVLAHRELMPRPVRAKENWAVLFGLLALGTELLFAPLLAVLDRTAPELSRWLPSRPPSGAFEFVRSPLRRPGTVRMS